MTRVVKTKTGKQRIKQANRGYRLPAPSKKWVDPFPDVRGTLPEKIVYAALSARNIAFQMTTDLRFQFPDLDFDKTYNADFVLTDLKVIIEVQGAYWHSKPATLEADAFKFAVYQTGGWRPLAWWDYDILANVDKLFELDAQLSQFQRVRIGISSERDSHHRLVNGQVRDDAKGIRTLNARRKLPKSAAGPRRGLRKALR